MQQKIKVHPGGKLVRDRLDSDTKTDQASHGRASSTEDGRTEVRISKPASESREPVFKRSVCVCVCARVLDKPLCGRGGGGVL